MDKDILKHIFKNQIKFNKMISIPLEGLNVDKAEKLTKEHVLALVSELGEVLDRINWKYWKKSKKDLDIHELALELVDVFIFVVNLFIIWGITPEELLDLYNEKKDINVKRQEDGY